MKRLVKFSDESESYRFELVGDEDTVFEISKSTLKFSADKFYRCFFKDVSEKPSYEIMKPTEELRGQPKHVFDTVEDIFTKACNSIDESWFVSSGNGVDDCGDSTLD